LRAGVVRRRSNQLVVGSLLNNMGGPATGTGYNENGCEELNGDAALVVDRGRVEVQVGEHLFFFHQQVFNVLTDLIKLGVAIGLSG